MAQSQHPPETVDTEMNLFTVLNVLVKRKMLICCMTVVAAILSVILSFSMKNVYTATAKILPPQREGGGGISTLISQAGGLAALAAGAGLSGSSDLYVGILKSRSVADGVINKLDLARELKAKNLDIARLKLAKKVRIQSDTKSGIITIAADDRNPVLAANLANSFVEELGRTTVKLNLSKVGIERLFLEKRLALVKADLKKAEDALKDFAQHNKVVQVDSQAKASIEGLAKLKAEVASREVQLSALRTYQTDESPEVNALQAGIRKLQQEIVKLSGSDKGGEGIPSIGTVPALGLEYARRMREVKVQEAVFEQLTKQHEVAKLNEAKDSSTIQVLDTAVVPIQKSKPKRSMIIILATVTAFFLSVIFSFALEHMNNLSEADKLMLASMKKQLFQFRGSKNE